MAPVNVRGGVTFVTSERAHGGRVRQNAQLRGHTLAYVAPCALPSGTAPPATRSACRVPLSQRLTRLGHVHTWRACRYFAATYQLAQHLPNVTDTTARVVFASATTSSDRLAALQPETIRVRETTAAIEFLVQHNPRVAKLGTCTRTGHVRAICVSHARPCAPQATRTPWLRHSTPCVPWLATMTGS